MAQIEVLPESMTGFEYAVPCIAKDCDETAVAFIRLSHSADDGCMWSAGNFRCQVHYESKRDEMASWLKRAKRCPMCEAEVSGNLEQNMRVMPL